MYLVIDAYNVLKQVIPVREISQQQRERFINAIIHYAKRKSHFAVIVFDGGTNIWPSTEQKKHCTITYSGSKMSADDYIQRYISENKNRDILLVSTDRALTSWAKQHSIHAIDAIDFYKFLQADAVKKESKSKYKADHIIKTTTDDNQFVDDLMVESAITVPHKNEESNQMRPPHSQKESKQERKILQKIRKL